MSSESSDVSASFYHFLGWLETNRRNLALGLAAAILLAFAVVAYRWNASQTELAANAALLKLRATAPRGTTEPTATPEDYQKIVAAFPSTAAADRAAILAAEGYFAAGKYTEAHDAFKQYLTASPGTPLAPTAALGVASALEALGKIEEAMAAYQNAQTAHPRSAFVDHAKLAVGRLHEARNQPEQALKVYEEMTRVPATSSAGSQATVRKDRLLNAHPELVKTNAPVSGLTNSLPKAP